MPGSPTVEMDEVVAGYIEHFEPFAIAGWAGRHDGKPLRLELHIRGEVRVLSPAWFAREDVAAQRGARFAMSGFRCALSNAAAFAVRNALLRDDPIEVVADGVVLRNLAKIPAPASLLMTEPLMISHQSADCRAVVESWGHFMLFGWALVDGREARDLSLRCNGTYLPCTFSNYERPDVAEALGSAGARAGFEVEMPGYLWEDVPQNAEVHLELCIGDKVVTEQPLVLSRARAGEWVAQICRMYEGQEKQHRLLHALEHVRYGKLGPDLDDGTLACIEAFAARMNLQDFVSAEISVRGDRVPVPSASPTQLLLERALRSLNAMLVSSAEDVLTCAKKIIRDQQIVGEPLERFLMAVVPMLCRTGQLKELGGLMSLARLRQLESEPGLWEMSLAPPALVLNGDVERATGVFLRMSRRPDRGWLNTECVRFAVVQTLHLEASGGVEPDVAEGLRNAFIELLDGFKAEWFSRLHDQELVDTMIDILDGLNNYSDQHRKEVVSAAIRVYGLSPSFWAHMAEREVPLTVDLAEARAAWLDLSGGLARTGGALIDQIPAISSAIAYFMRRDAKEAVIILRDVVANALREPRFVQADAGRRMIDELVEKEGAEALRIAAAPVDRSVRLSRYTNDDPAILRGTLRLSSECPRSPLFDLQEEVASLLNRLPALADKGDLDSLRACVQQLRIKARILSTESARYLGADVLAQGYRVSRQVGLSEQNAMLTELGEVLHKALSRTRANACLVQPLQTALAHLASLPPDTLLTAFLQEAEALLGRKLAGEPLAFFPRASDDLVFAQCARGWPSDLLVVIYSCRMYLGTRIEAIRQAWLRDLSARGIPYLIVVGDGDGSVHGDVLELAVPDRYEDLPRKTLALLEWVERNSDAQFLLKIDDDCYLDVNRYIDSLSYRKYPYYGRIVSCEEGHMDRRWHAAKSRELRGKKSLDKSPEPAIYVNGGGAYCLSRSAIREALQIASTDAGRRLLSCSFMEDKLIGDLLALAGIAPSNEDYELYYRSRPSRGSPPVGRWENGFFPSSATPTKVVHLDRETDQDWVAKNASEKDLWPKKIWPTYDSPSIAANSNQLELITDTGKVGRLLSGQLFVVAVVRNESTILPHFLAHYRGLGVESFIFVDNCSDDGTAELLHRQDDVVLYSTDTEYRHSHYGVCWQQAVLGNHCLGKWVVLADADEFLVYENCEETPLLRHLEEVEQEGGNGLMVHMIDMYPYGDLADARFSEMNPFEAAPFFDRDAQIELVYGGGQFSNSRNFVNGLRHRLAPSRINAYVSQKYAVFKYQPWIRFSEGVHYAANMTASTRNAYFAHFKYHSEFKAKVIREINRKQHYNNAEEYQKYLSILSESRGGFGDPGKSIQYANSGSFVRAFKGLDPSESDVARFMSSVDCDARAPGVSQ